MTDRARSRRHSPPIARVTPDVADPRLEEVEAVARIGSYATDLVSGRWASSPGLDAIFGIGADFGRTVPGWASIVHPDDREAMVAYLNDDVLGRRLPFDREYRIRRQDTGETRWVHGRGRLELDAEGRPARMVGTIADITDERRAREALASSERRYAAIFEGTSEAIFIVEESTMRIRWSNPAASALLGFTAAELEGLPVASIHAPEDEATVLADFAAMRAGRDVARSIPCRRRDGSTVMVNIRGSRIDFEGGAFMVGFFTDITSQERAEAALRASELRYRNLVQQSADGILVSDDSACYIEANSAICRMLGYSREELIGMPAGALSDADDPVTSEDMDALLAATPPGEGLLVERRYRRRDGSSLPAEVNFTQLPDGRLQRTIRDITDRLAAEAERTRLVSAVEQTSDAVIIADLEGSIEYVNPAFEQMSGYSRAEAVGRNPRMLKSGRQSTGFYRAMWRRLARGESWSGRMVNRRADGALYEVQATLSPIRGHRGDITGYVGLHRDVTAVRAAESALAAEFRERARVAASLARLQPRGTAGETAGEICGELLGLPGIHAAAIFDFTQPGRATTLAAGGPDGLPFSPGLPLPEARASYLYERAVQGPWAEAWRTRPEDGAYGMAMAAVGVKAIACAPIQNGDGLLGLVAAATFDAEYARHLVDHLPAVGEFAATSSALLSGQLERAHRSEVAKNRIRSALDRRAFRTVFQPIRALASATPVGFEALTRFDEGTPPDRMIADAHGLGLGREMELRLLAAALDAAEGLSPDTWLSLNVSPDVIVLVDDLQALLAGRDRRVVFEVTEHVQIEDYPAISEAVVLLGPEVSLAVDDAGSGFASLHHVVELRPRFLKLDISLVRGVDLDLSRQAMVAGMAQFARRAECEVIAEGVETQGELDMLRELGVRLGQGYLLGRPEAPPVAP